jgi:ribosomal protein S27AE
MKTSTQKMKCPGCGGEMNHHADKIDYPGGVEYPESVDPVLGGVIEEFHSCPRCGSSASRAASRANR